MTYAGQESTFEAAVVEVEPGDGAVMVLVRAVGPGGMEVRFECMAGEHEMGGVAEVTIRQA